MNVTVILADEPYEASRDLLSQVRSVFGGATISQYDYANDSLGRRAEISRSGSAMSETRSDAYGYNARNELTNAVKNATLGEYAYQYDDIGNRLSSLDLGETREYTANNLNQYTSISNSAPSAPSEGDFTPQFDLDGNQTLIRTSTGIWSVAYNAENRPVSWTCGTTNVVMAYDRMGRRVLSRETVGGVVTDSNYNFVYDGYLCVQRIQGATKKVKLIFSWDPLEKVATKPLMVEKPSSYKMYVTHDGNKNVSELVFFSGGSGIAAHYEYAPFGAITASTRDTSVTACDFRTYNPFRFSSEYADDTIGLVYYNYRHYNPLDGRWMNYDRHDPFAGYVFVINDGIGQTDYLGFEPSSSAPTPSQQGRDCIYRVYAAHGISDPDLSLWDSYRLQKFADQPNGDRYGYWGCGANVINKMTGEEHPEFDLPVVFPKGERVNKDTQKNLVKRGMKPNYAKRFETISDSPNPFLEKTIERLKKFAKEESGDMCCRCKSITIKIDCSNALRNAEVFRLLKNEERDKVQEEATRRKEYDSRSLNKIAYELYSATYKGKLKCGTKTIVK